MEIKKLSGRPQEWQEWQEWQEFWDSYKNAVYENEQLNDIDNDKRFAKPETIKNADINAMIKVKCYKREKCQQFARAFRCRRESSSRTTSSKD